MNRSKMKDSTWWVLFFSVLTLTTTSVCWGAGEILFEEDFESGLDENVWIPAGTWKIIDGTLDIEGGGEGFTVRNDFTDFEFSADFLIVAGYNAFLMRVQDAGNLYGHMVGADDPIMWWHSKEGDEWTPVEKPIEKAPIPKLNVWYRMKFIAEGSQFPCLMAERGEELDEAKHLVGTWEHDAFASGAIGFRESGSEHCRYDNVLVTTIGFDGVKPTAVRPAHNLLIAWGNIKKAY